MQKQFLKSRNNNFKYINSDDEAKAKTKKKLLSLNRFKQPKADKNNESLENSNGKNQRFYIDENIKNL